MAAFSNIIDYIRWRGDLSDKVLPFGEVDYLILSMLVYCRMEEARTPVEGRTLRDTYLDVCCKKKKDLTGYEPERYELWKEAAASERFGNLTIDYFTKDFCPEVEIQFAAALFSNGETGHLIFRGTDGTVTGWKEDLNMSFEEEVPSDKAAVKLVEEMAQRYPTLHIAGHSKGGRIATYSAFGCKEETFRKIVDVWSYDGPGLQSYAQKKPRWKELEKKSRAFIPMASVIGMIYEPVANPTVVMSRSIGVLQHDPFLWYVMGAHLVESTDTTLSSKLMDRTIRHFLEECTPEERKILVDTIHSVVETAGEEKISAIPQAAIHRLPAILSTLTHIPEKNRKVVGELAGALLESGAYSVKHYVEDKRNKEDKP